MTREDKKKQSGIPTKTDGGYYAIKGFTYQFDKTLLEIIENPDQNIEIEQIQDIGLQRYYIQVKHKESQIYSSSKIRKALIQIINCFICDKRNSFSLYCYFRNKVAKKKKLTLIELDGILSTDKGIFNQKDKRDFINKFTLEFADNFDKQFELLIKKIKNCFKLKNDEEAILYHAVFMANLLEIAIKKNPKKRIISYDELKTLATQKEKIIFDIAYCKFLSETKYLSYLKREYFTLKKINIPNEDRLFLIEIDNVIKNNDILQIVTNIRNKYFRKHASPAPYICLFGNISRERLASIKRKLWDKEMFFIDGTNFESDKFRISDLIKSLYDNNSRETYKLVLIKNLSILLKRQVIDQIFVFSTTSNKTWYKDIKEFKEFYIKQTKNIIKIIN